MEFIWNADDNFRRDVVKDTADPMSKVAEKLIHLKEIGEKTGAIATTRFTGFGANPRQRKADPAKRLRELVMKNEKTKKPSKKTIKGGFAPALLAVPAVTAVVSTVVSKLFDVIKEKITGHGLKIPFKYYSRKNKYVDRLREAQKRIIL